MTITLARSNVVEFTPPFIYTGKYNITLTTFILRSILDMMTFYILALAVLPKSYNVWQIPLILTQLIACTFSCISIGVAGDSKGRYKKLL